MYGIPAILKTRTDYENIHSLALAGKTSKTAVMSRWQGLIDNQHVYVFDRVLAANESPDGTEPAYKVVINNLADDVSERHQFKQVIDPAALINKMGYTTAEAQSKIAELGGI